MQFSKYDSLTVIKDSVVLYCFRFFSKGMAPVTDVMTRGKRFISIVAWHGHLSKISGVDSSVEMSRKRPMIGSTLQLSLNRAKVSFLPCGTNEKFINLSREEGL